MHNIGTIAAKLIVGAAILLATWTALLLMCSGVARADTLNWDALAQCESGGNWSTDTGNGFYGGLQFTQATWNAHGGSGAPHRASRAEQIRVAEKVLRSQGLDAWPTCGRNTTFSGPASAPTAAPGVGWPGGGAVRYVNNTVGEIASLIRQFMP